MTFFSVILFHLSGCEPDRQANAPDKTPLQATFPEPAHSNVKTVRWYDPIVREYIHKTDHADTTSWMLDVQHADTAVFYIFHLGHDVTDEDGSSPRFATDGWLYIDSLTGKVYEYDMAEDRLRIWSP